MHEAARTDMTSPDQTEIEIEFTDVLARSDRLPALRHALAEWAYGQGLDDSHVGDLTLAAYEALSNVAAHAYPDHAPGTLDLWARYQPEQRHLEITVSDHGRWIPPPHDPGPFGGRGIPLMHSLAEHTDIQPSHTGTTVHLQWTLRATDAKPPRP